MTQNALYAAIAGIDEAYLSDSEDVKKIKADFRKERIIRRSLSVSFCAVIVAFVCVIGTKNVLRVTPPMTNSTAPTDAVATSLNSISSPLPTENTINNTTPPTSGSDTSAPMSEQSEQPNAAPYALIPFSASIDPNADAYGEDEIHEVSLTVYGIRYEQLTEDEYRRYGISQPLPESALGESVGTVVESFPNQEPNPEVCSPDPSLAGAEVYYYAQTGGKAVVIAKKDGRCSPFAVSHWGVRSFADACAFFGADPSASGIESISYTVAVPENGGYRVSEEKTIADAEAVDEICKVLLQLTPEDPTDGASATPGWFIDAMQAYKDYPGEAAAEDIVMTVRFRNGTVMRDILYKPYIGNGYLDNMKELTPEQNAELRALFG